MNRIDIADFRRAHDPIDSQIAIRARWRADADGFIRELHMQRITVRFGVNRERANPQLLAGADHAQGYFAAVCDEDFLEHQVLREPDTTSALAGRYLPDAEKHLAELHWFAVLGHDFGDRAGHLRFDLVHHLHRFDDANDAVFAHRFTDFDKGWRFRGTLAIECADHR